MATTVRDMNNLSDRLDTLVDRLTREYNVELPQERKDAKGDTSLLAAIDKRKGDLVIALQMHKDAKVAFMTAKGAYQVNPTVMDTNYAEAFGLAAQMEAVLDYRTSKGSDTSKTDTKADKAKDEGKDKKETKDDAAKEKDGKSKTDTDDKADPKTDSAKEKAEGKDKKPAPETDPVLAAIAEFREECRTGNAKLREELAELAKGTLPEELALILKDLDPEAAKIIVTLNVDHLNAMLGSTLSPQAAGVVAELAAYTPEELKLMLANLAAVSDRAEKLRKVLPGGRKAKGEKDPK